MIKFENIKSQDDLNKAVEATIEEQVKGLVNKNTELLGKLSDAKKVAAPDNLDQLIADQAKLKKIEDGELEKNQEYKKLLDNSKAQHEEAIGKLQKELDAEKGITKKLLVNDGLAKALGKHKVNPVLLEAAVSILQKDVSVIDKDGKRVAQVGEKGLEEFVKDWSATDVGKNFILAPDNGGGGSEGNGEKTKVSEHEIYFQAKTWNLTKQGALSKSDPELYKTLHEKYPTSKAGANAAS